MQICQKLSFAWKALVIVGVLVGIMGIVFALQGYGIVGPSSSSMYQASSWKYYGAGIAIVGLLIFLAGIMLASSSVKKMKATSSPSDQVKDTRPKP